MIAAESWSQPFASVTEVTGSRAFSPGAQQVLTPQQASAASLLPFWVPQVERDGVHALVEARAEQAAPGAVQRVAVDRALARVDPDDRRAHLRQCHRGQFR